MLESIEGMVNGEKTEKVIVSGYRKLIKNTFRHNLCKSKVTLNTLSPFNLIGPRYFESMISGSINFCQKSKFYSKIFREFEHYIPFKSDLSDFNEMFINKSQQMFFLQRYWGGHAIN